jgi:hypothetical protein
MEMTKSKGEGKESIKLLPDRRRCEVRIAEGVVTTTAGHREGGSDEMD